MEVIDNANGESKWKQRSILVLCRIAKKPQAHQVSTKEACQTEKKPSFKDYTLIKVFASEMCNLLTAEWVGMGLEALSLFFNCEKIILEIIFFMAQPTQTMKMITLPYIKTFQKQPTIATI